MSEIITKKILVISIIVIGIFIIIAINALLFQPNLAKVNTKVSLFGSGSSQGIKNTEKPIKADTSQAIKPQQLYTPAPQLSQPLRPALKPDTVFLNRPQLASTPSETLRGYSVPDLRFRNPINRNSLQKISSEPMRLDPRYAR